MGVPTSEVGYTPAMPRREDHEVHKGHVVALGGGNIILFMIISRWILLIMRNISHKICGETQNKFYVRIVFFFRKSCLLWDVAKYCQARQATDGNITRRKLFVYWIPKATKHTLRISNIYCFSTATLVSETRLIVTLYIHCLPWYVIRTFITVLTAASHSSLSSASRNQYTPSIWTHVFLSHLCLGLLSCPSPLGFSTEIL